MGYKHGQNHSPYRQSKLSPMISHCTSLTTFPWFTSTSNIRSWWPATNKLELSFGSMHCRSDRFSLLQHTHYSCQYWCQKLIMGSCLRKDRNNTAKLLLLQLGHVLWVFFYLSYWESTMARNLCTKLKENSVEIARLHYLKPTFSDPKNCTYCRVH